MSPFHPDRRHFLGTAAGAAIATLGASVLPSTASATAARPPSNHPLRILILGGTSFLGPHQIAYALGRGHTVTTFTRGRTEPTVHRRLFGEVEQLVGDRDSDLSALRSRRWDAVIDNSGQKVEWATEAAELLRDTVDLYLYTSSTGVYYPYLGTDIDESTEVAMETPPEVGDGDGAYNYGVMKARSESEVRRVFGEERAIIVRPTYIFGPGDRTDRFTYWPVRLDRGGDVLIPGPDDAVQYIDVRDVASWMIRLIEARNAGTFNAAGPARPTTMETFVHGAHAAFSSPVTFVPIPDRDFLAEHGIRFSVPWIPPVGNNYGSASASVDKALANGLAYTPLAEGVRDTLEWWASGVVPEDRRERMMSGERSLMARESEVLSAWRARQD